MRFFSSVAFLFTLARLSTRVDAAGLVALNHQANTGLLPGPIDHAYSACLGPRFYNALLENDFEELDKSVITAASIPCLLKCGATIAKILPCVIKAVMSGNPADILKCGLGKPQICPCAQCLPDKYKDWVNKHFCGVQNKAFDASPTTELSGVDLSGIQESNIQALLGTTNEMEGPGLRSFGFCPGAPCGGCSCCVGACMFGSCLGYCLPFAAEQIEIKAGGEAIAAKSEL